MRDRGEVADRQLRDILPTPVAHSFAALYYSRETLRRLSSMSGPVRSVTALKRWSCAENQLPPVDAVKAVHVYDFDNTRKSRSSRLMHRAIRNTKTLLSVH